MLASYSRLIHKKNGGQGRLKDFVRLARGFRFLVLAYVAMRLTRLLARKLLMKSSATPGIAHYETTKSLSTTKFNSNFIVGIYTVAVIIPLHNQGKYLNDTLSSLISQRNSDWEAIIVDDGSTDDSYEQAAYLVAFYKNQGFNISLVRTPNYGLASARNTGVQLTRAPFLLALDADDVLSDSFLDLSVSVLQRNLSVNLVSADLIGFGADFEYFWQIPQWSPAELPFKNMFHCR